MEQEKGSRVDMESQTDWRMDYVASLENTLDFFSSLASDKDSLNYLLNGLKQDLPKLELNDETLSAAVTLMNKLPKLVRYIEAVEPFLDFASGVLADETSLRYLTTEMGRMTEPVQSTLDQGKSLLEEAKRRAKKDGTQIGVFTLVKLLRSPTVQTSIKVAKSALEVIDEKKQATRQTTA
ncbi:hypothetical protein [Alicyclobacillus mengziensis]|uniref:DUF1641 domain-containing protein n=1 Tax=Alicyclobacillus mengziensis TaxID=2931921 RepID=A0A9X7VXK4_9BACL|nr:hypothetical protein [Alicyclobacillus mengziensis]QSO46332.1 hypothetical protein JZ786_17795 [Alicyclobacillus mengziensis]